jgi:hypothetical protein
MESDMKACRVIVFAVAALMTSAAPASALMTTAVPASAPKTNAAPTAVLSVNDVRCLLASNIFAKGANDDKAKRVAEAGAYFYLGRIDGRFKADQLKAALVAQRKTITNANASAIMSVCARYMAESSKALQDLSAQLIKAK